MATSHVWTLENSLLTMAACFVESLFTNWKQNGHCVYLSLIRSLQIPSPFLCCNISQFLWLSVLSSILKIILYLIASIRHSSLMQASLLQLIEDSFSRVSGG